MRWREQVSDHHNFRFYLTVGSELKLKQQPGLLLLLLGYLTHPFDFLLHIILFNTACPKVSVPKVYMPKFKAQVRIYEMFYTGFRK